MRPLSAIRTYIADVALAAAMLICLGGTLSFILLTTLERQRDDGFPRPPANRSGNFIFQEKRP